jgi:hypothetical protein
VKVARGDFCGNWVEPLQFDIDAPMHCWDNPKKTLVIHFNLGAHVLHFVLHTSAPLPMYIGGAITQKRTLVLHIGLGASTLPN